MKGNRKLYESISFNNFLMRNVNDEVHQKNINEIKGRQNQFLKISQAQPNTNQSYIKPGNSSLQPIKRNSNSNFDENYIFNMNRDNQILYQKIKNMYESNKSPGLVANELSWAEAQNLKKVHTKSLFTRRKIEQHKIDDQNDNLYKRLSKIAPVLKINKIIENSSSKCLINRRDLSVIYKNAIKETKNKNSILNNSLNAGLPNENKDSIKETIKSNKGNDNSLVLPEVKSSRS